MRKGKKHLRRKGFNSAVPSLSQRDSLLRAVGVSLRPCNCPFHKAPVIDSQPLERNMVQLVLQAREHNPKLDALRKGKKRGHHSTKARLQAVMFVTRKESSSRTLQHSPAHPAEDSQGGAIVCETDTRDTMECRASAQQWGLVGWTWFEESWVLPNSLPSALVVVL